MTEQRQQERVRFGPERTSLAAAIVFFLGTLPAASSSPAFVPLLLVPVLCGVWVLRARVVASTAGLEVCNGLGVGRYRWEDVTGFDVPRRGPVRLLRAGRRPVPLTALSRHLLPRVLEVGRRAAA